MMDEETRRRKKVYQFIEAMTGMHDSHSGYGAVYPKSKEVLAFLNGACEYGPANRNDFYVQGDGRVQIKDSEVSLAHVQEMYELIALYSRTLRGMLKEARDKKEAV